MLVRQTVAEVTIVGSDKTLIVQPPAYRNKLLADLRVSHGKRLFAPSQLDENFSNLFDSWATKAQSHEVRRSSCFPSMTANIIPIPY